MKTNWFTYFVYISLIFLIVSLIKFDYLIFPNITSYIYLALSILFLCVGFICSALPWYSALTQSKYSICVRDSIISVGLPIFSKYIPGKVWSILGPPAFISKEYELPIKELTTLSLNTQLLILWVGLLLGAVGLFTQGSTLQLGWITFILWFILTMGVFTNIFHTPLAFVATKLLNRDINIPRLKFVSVIKILPYVLLNWIIWCFGFHFFIQSLSNVNIPFTTGLGFAWAATLGILAIVTPGGLGVREGALVSYLVLSGLGIEEATTISIASRLWFILGEIFIFIMGLTLRMKNKHKDTSAVS